MKSKKIKIDNAHCCWCHENFPEKKVKFLKSGADVCPKCKTQNFTIFNDGHANCNCDNFEKAAP